MFFFQFIYLAHCDTLRKLLCAILLSLAKYKQQKVDISRRRRKKNTKMTKFSAKSGFFVLFFGTEKSLSSTAISELFYFYFFY